jgi:hypothetical protein
VRWPDPHTGQAIRVEHWVVAQRQGQTAALNMLGHGEAFDAVPFFWSQHYDMPINYVGHAEAWDELAVEGDIAGKDCLVRYKAKGRTLAVASIYRDVGEPAGRGGHGRGEGLGFLQANWRNDMAADNKANGKRRLRSREWFDAPGDPTMAALYLERYMNFGLTLGELHSNPADHRHRPDRQRPLALQSPPSRSRDPRARRHPRRRRHPDRVSRASHPGDRQAARPRRSTATSPISAWSRACTAISSTASC